MAPRRGKWPAAGANAPRGRSTAFRNKFRDMAFPDSPMTAASNGFSMRDEARHTASHQSSWASGDAKLRERPVAFVSAGVVEPLKDTKLPTPSDPNTAEEPDEDVAGAIGNDAEAGDVEISEMEATSLVKVQTTLEAVEQETSAGEQEASVVEQETSIVEQETTIVEQQASVVDEETSIVKQETTVIEQETTVVENASQPTESQATEPKDLFFFDLEGDETMHSNSLPPPNIPSPRSSFGTSDSSEEVILFRGRSTNARGVAQKNERVYPNQQPALSGDSAERKATSLRVTTIPGSPDIKSPTQPLRKRSKSQRRNSRPLRAKEDDEEDEILADYIANMAANSEDDFIAHQLKSLAGYRDLGGDDDAFNFGSDEDIKWPRADDSPAGEDAGSVSSSISDGEGDELMDANDDHDMDAGIDDETLARLLSKQEQLGIGGDELFIYPGSSGSKNRRAKRSAGARNVPANASQVADAFDDLDLADWGQPPPRKRRSKQPPNFNVSDSELEAALRNSWSRDRERKKTRKLEREALRAEGLLGKNVDPDALRVKYLSGMKLDDVKAEMTSFLLGSEERLEFPPLDKHARKILHELADKFNIKSKSTGKGDQRRPVLYRTKRTTRYASTRVDDATKHVDEAAMRIHRKYFHRVDVKVKGSGPPRAAAGGGRSGHKALTLREGEIVGASVPELGQENKGRTMLEKMGWSKGMALGSIENQGILEPVAQVMKRSKAGLG